MSAEQSCERALARALHPVQHQPAITTARWRSTVGLMAPLPHGKDDRLLAVAGRITEFLDRQ